VIYNFVIIFLNVVIWAMRITLNVQHILFSTIFKSVRSEFKIFYKKIALKNYYSKKKRIINLRSDHVLKKQFKKLKLMNIK
jgi:hypothetical protein